MNRRELLKGLALGVGAAALGGCASKRQGAAAPRAVGSRLKLAKVLADASREIRTIAGLRPFRPAGFRVEAEKLGDKLLVHNYGHGGAGITLSWGTARLATDLVHASGSNSAAVIGCGVVGLATARLLQEMGTAATIYAKTLPPETTSNVAGGLWEPFSVFDADQVTPEFRQQLMTASRFAYKYFQAYASEDYGIRWMPAFTMSQRPLPADSMFGPASPMREFHPGLRDVPPDEHDFPYAHVRQFNAMLIEPHHYLRALMRDFRMAGGKIVVREFRSPQEMMGLAEPAIVNCTGLGARELFADQQLIPVKGQLTFLLPQPEVNYITLAESLYMFPRRDGILLGGTFVRGDSTLEPDPEAKTRILAGHARVFANL